MVEAIKTCKLLTLEVAPNVELDAIIEKGAGTLGLTLHFESQERNLFLHAYKESIAETHNRKQANQRAEDAVSKDQDPHITVIAVCQGPVLNYNQRAKPAFRIAQWDRITAVN